MVTSKYIHFGGMYCLFLQHLTVLDNIQEDLNLQFMENRHCISSLRNLFLLMYRITCWVNTLLQVLRAAPALHSLIIRDRKDVADILEFLFHKHVDLRKLILKCSWLGEDGTGLLANIVALYPDLEGLSLDDCYPITSAGYCLLPRLKKLSELNLSSCEVDCVC